MIMHGRGGTPALSAEQRGEAENARKFAGYKPGTLYGRDRMQFKARQVAAQNMAAQPGLEDRPERFYTGKVKKVAPAGAGSIEYETGF